MKLPILVPTEINNSRQVIPLLWSFSHDISLPAVLEELKPRLMNRNTLAYVLMLEGMIAMSRGDLEHSVTLHEQSLELFREIQNTQGIITCLGHLGLLALILGDYESAPAMLRESLHLALELDYKQSIQHCLHTLACVMACREQPVRAARLWKAWRRLTARTSPP